MPFVYDVVTPAEESFIRALPVNNLSTVSGAVRVAGTAAAHAAATSPVVASTPTPLLIRVRRCITTLIAAIAAIAAVLVVCVVFLFVGGGSAKAQDAFDLPRPGIRIGSLPRASETAAPQQQTPAATAEDDAASLRAPTKTNLVDAEAVRDRNGNAVAGTAQVKQAHQQQKGQRSAPKERTPTLTTLPRNAPPTSESGSREARQPVGELTPPLDRPLDTLPPGDFGLPDLPQAARSIRPITPPDFQPTPEVPFSLRGTGIDPAFASVATAAATAVVLLLLSKLPRPLRRYAGDLWRRMPRRKRTPVHAVAVTSAVPQRVIPLTRPPLVYRSASETWTIGMAADKGPVRKRMEDAAEIFCANGARIMVVADGVGGEPDGGIAAQTAVRAAKEILSAPGAPPNMRAIQGAIARAATEVACMARDRGITFGARTTLIIAALADGVCRYGYLGDGGLVHVRGADGVTTSFLAPQRDEQGRLTASIGPVTHGTAIIGAVHMLPGDVMLAGSDGIWERTSDMGDMGRWLLRAVDCAGGDGSRGLMRGVDEFVTSKDDTGSFIADDNATVTLLGTGHRPAFLDRRASVMEANHAAA